MQDFEDEDAPLIAAPAATGHDAPPLPERLQGQPSVALICSIWSSPEHVGLSGNIIDHIEGIRSRLVLPACETLPKDSIWRVHSAARLQWEFQARPNHDATDYEQAVLSAVVSGADCDIRGFVVYRVLESIALATPWCDAAVPSDETTIDQLWRWAFDTLGQKHCVDGRPFSEALRGLEAAPQLLRFDTHPFLGDVLCRGEVLLDPRGVTPLLEQARRFGRNSTYCPGGWLISVRSARCYYRPNQRLMNIFRQHLYDLTAWPQSSASSRLGAPAELSPAGE